MTRKKTLVLLLFLFAFIRATNAQTTAADWTLIDCKSDTYNLFSYLDAEDVVIMEFGMGCSSCSNAGTYLLNIKNQFEITHPGKVKVFYMDYWSGNFCATSVTPITDTMAFDAGFEHCNPEKTYYMTGSPMPGVVIAAGSNHLVIYEKNNFFTGDTTEIKDSITNFFNTVGLNEIESNSNNAILFPNPSNGQLNINLNWNNNENGAIKIYSLLGEEILNLTTFSLVKGNQELILPFLNLTDGNYILSMQSIKQSLNLPLTIKH